MASQLRTANALPSIAGSALRLWAVIMNYRVDGQTDELLLPAAGEPKASATGALGEFETRKRTLLLFSIKSSFYVLSIKYTYSTLLSLLDNVRVCTLYVYSIHNSVPIVCRV